MNFADEQEEPQFVAFDFNAIYPPMPADWAARYREEQEDSK